MGPTVLQPASWPETWHWPRKTNPASPCLNTNADMWVVPVSASNPHPCALHRVAGTGDPHTNPSFHSRILVGE